jgi:hypothetical protein
MKKFFASSLCTLACLVVLSCAPPESTPTHSQITGHVYDGMNGAPVPNATVRYGNGSGTTGADGAFSIDLGTTAGVLEEAMGFSASGYGFMYIDQVKVDTAGTNNLVVRLKPLTEILYPVKTVHCKIFETNGTTEIVDATRVILAVLPMNGRRSDTAAQTTSYDGGEECYVLWTNRHSDDCLVLILVERPTTAQSFCAHLTGVDLSGSEPVDLVFVEPTVGYTDVVLTAESPASQAEGQFVTPYGLLPMVCTYDDTDSSQTVLKTTVEFGADGTTETVTVYNPDNWPCSWLQKGVDGAYGGTSTHALMSTTAIGTMASSVTLPDLNAGLGPSSDPVETSWQYDAVAGSISIDAIPDARLLQFAVVNASPAFNLGTIVSFSNPVVLPAWLNDIISADSPRSMYMIPMDTDLVAYELDMANRDTYPAPAGFGVLLDGSTPFEKDFAF